jgi:hypothetical protein
MFAVERHADVLVDRTAFEGAVERGQRRLRNVRS